MSANDKMTRARTTIVLESPFFATLLLRMDCVADPLCDTMSTNGERIRYNPAWVDTLPIKHVEGVLAHEVMHVAMSHHLRRGNRNPKVWNQACDFAINKIVLDAGFELPSDGLLDPRFAGQSAEAIYSQLAKPVEEEKGSSDQPQAGEQPDDANGNKPSPSWGEVEDAPLDEQSGEEQQAEIQVAVAQAANAAKAAGKLPAFLEEIAEQIKKGRVDWQTELRRFCQATTKDQYTWNRPDRRHVARGFILPTLAGRSRMGEMVLAIDTSASTNAFADEFLAEVLSLVEDLQPEKLHVVYCDTRVQKVITIEPSVDDIPTKLPRIFGGGTSFSPVFRWVEKQGIDPACLVYLTDLYGDSPAEPDYPVLWASVTNVPPPFGEVLRLKD